MLILVLFVFPILLSILLFFVKSKIFNIISIVAYAFVYITITIMLYFKPESFTEFFRIDSINILFLFILAILNLGVSIYNIDYLKNSTKSNKEISYYSIFYLLFMLCMTGVILSTHLGLLWVFIEATTLATAYLIYFNKTKESLEAAWKYIFICSIGISLAFVGIILLSIGKGTSTTLFFDSLYNHAGIMAPFWIKLAFIFILIGFGTKMGLAPVHAWLPDAHSESPSPVSALLSGALLNSAFLGIMRVYKIMVDADLASFANIFLLIMGFFSIFVCAVFLMRVKNYKRMLAYSSIENMGIIAISIAIGGQAIFAAMLHMIAHSLTKGSFFLTAGNILHRYNTKSINHVRGLLKDDKVNGWLWILSFIALIGIPPFPIFISEFILIRAMIASNNLVLAILLLLLLTIVIFGLSRLVLKMSFGESESNAINKNYKPNIFVYLPQILFLLILLAIGIYIPDFLKNIIYDIVKNF